MSHRLPLRVHRRLARALCLLWLLSLAVTLAQACALPGSPALQGWGGAEVRTGGLPPGEPAEPASAHGHDTAAELCQGYCEDTRITPVQAKPWTDLLDAVVPAALPCRAPARAVAEPPRFPALPDPAPPEPAVHIRFLRLTL